MVTVGDEVQLVMIKRLDKNGEEIDVEFELEEWIPTIAMLDNLLCWKVQIFFWAFQHFNNKFNESVNVYYTTTFTLSWCWKTSKECLEVRSFDPKSFTVSHDFPGFNQGWLEFVLKEGSLRKFCQNLHMIRWPVIFQPDCKITHFTDDICLIRGILIGSYIPNSSVCFHFYSFHSKKRALPIRGYIFIIP